MLISPPDGEFYSDAAAERIGKQMTERFRYGDNGGVLVVTDAMKVTPITYPAKDLAGLQLADNIRQRVCNVYHVPPTLIFMQDSNRASAEAGNYSLAVNCIRPRMTKILDVLNARLTPLFDPRLFFATDELVPEDQAAVLAEKTWELNRNVVLVQNQAMTPNELRVWAELPPIAGGDKVVSPLGLPGLLPPVGQPEEEQVERDDNPPTQTDAPITNDLRSTVGGLQAIAALQQSYYSGQVPREAAVANVEILFGFTAEEAQSLFPEVAPVKLTPDEQPEAAAPEAPEDGQADDREEAGAKKKVVRRDPLVEILLRHLARQRDYVLGAVKELSIADAEAKRFPEANGLPWPWWGLKTLPERFMDLSRFDEDMAKDCMPILRATYDQASQELTARLGFDPDLPKVIRVNLADAVERQAVRFCAETNATTSLLVEDAIARTKEAIKDGEARGEALSYLQERVGEIFDSATAERVYQIANTEQKRAVASANLITAEESGVELEKVWLASANACEFCKRLDGARKALNEPFAVRGDNPIYSTIMTNPAHPNCFCDTLYEPK